MNNLNEHIKRMKQLFNSEHGIIKPLVSEQIEDEFDDLITKSSGAKPNGDSTTPINADRNANPNYKNSNDSFEDKDDMVNKPGSGKKLQASVNVVVKNKTTGKTEIPYNELGEDEDWAQIAQRKLEGEYVSPFETQGYGYYVIAEAEKQNYKDGDNITIEFDVPFVVTSLKADGNQNNISLINRNVSGNKTSIRVEARIIVDKNFMFSVRGAGKTDKPSPFESGQFNEFFFALRFVR
jgi:hypothetical protein